MSNRGYSWIEQPVPNRADPLWNGCMHAHVVAWAPGGTQNALDELLGSRDDAQNGIFRAGAWSPDPPNWEIGHGGRALQQDTVDPQLAEPFAIYENNEKWHPTIANRQTIDTGQVSIMCFFRPKFISAVGDSHSIFGKASSPAAANNEYNLGTDGTNDQYRIFVSPSVGQTSAAGGGPQSQEKFILLLGTYDGDNLDLWKDGTRVARTASANSGLPEIATKGLDFCGYSSGTADEYDGQFVAAAVWNRALLQQEIERLWADPFVMWRPPRREFFMGFAAMGGGGVPIIPNCNCDFFGPFSQHPYT